jgi:hypothetical protein
MNWLRDYWPALLGGIVGAMLAVALVAVVVVSVQQQNRLIKQCVADGHKEYECHAMLDDHTVVVPQPVVVPTR